MKIKVEGMSCQHCVARVQKALEAIDGINNVKVSLDDKSAEFDAQSSVKEKAVETAVTEAGYKFSGVV